MIGKPLIAEPFGPLQGVRILSSGTIVAQPFAAELAAEMGAEIIQIERPGVGDSWRSLGIRLDSLVDEPPVATNWIQERRNVFCVTLDLARPRGRDVFLKLLPCCDIWMESSKPGSYAKWGISDEEIWKHNPKLVITHVSGYGQNGHPDYVPRASYDAIAQAFGGMMYQTGFPENPPTRAVPWTGDYITALFALWSSLAGLRYAMIHGRGQTIDVAQYEAIHRTLGGTMIEYFQKGLVRERLGNRGSGMQPIDSFETKDGFVMICAGPAPYVRLLGVIGLDATDPKWQTAKTQLESIEGIEFDAILRGWVAERTTDEVVRILNAAQVPCSSMMTAEDMAHDPHYRARSMHIEWDDLQAGRVKGIGIVPKFSATPGKVWRGAPKLGQDNERVYCDLLGMSNDEIEALRRDKVI